MANEFIMTKETLAYMLGIVWDTFQKQESGKGLSEEDFTSALKAKLDGIPGTADENIIEAIKLAGNALTPDANKAVNIPVMTGAGEQAGGSIGLVPAPASSERAKYLQGNGTWSVPQDTTYDIVTALAAGLMSPAMLTKLNGIEEGATANIGTLTEIILNGVSKGTSGAVDLGTVLTEHQSLAHLAPKLSPAFTGTPTAPTASAGTSTTQVATTAFVTGAIATAIGQITGITFVFTETLPATGETGTIYFIPDSGGSGTNNFIEYVWNEIASEYEEVGRPQVDLSGYMQAADYPVVTDNEVDAIIAAL